MLRRLYDWTMNAAAHRHAPATLFGVSFVESSVFPIPPDVMLVPMALAQREKAWWFATIATLGSVIGGVFGYAIGYFLFELIGAQILNFYGLTDSFHHFATRYNEFGAWIVFIAGVTPFPYKVITIASGATQLNFLVFMIASLLARGLRFFLVAGLLYWFGEPVRAFIEERLGLATTIFTLLLVGGFIVIKYLV